MNLFDLLLAVSAIVILIFMIVVIQYLKYLRELIEYAVLTDDEEEQEQEEREESEESEENSDIPTIIAKSKEIACVFQDKTAYKYLKAENDRWFVFESIAVQQSEGKYYADDTNGFYLIIDKCFLYREINQSEINTFTQ